VADFGIANIAGEESAGASGTPAFAAPEQMLGENQDAAADCFSLAGVLYFALTGKAPFGEGETKVILARIFSGQVDVSMLDEPIGEWLKKAMASDADKRFADAASMQAAWREAVRGVLDRDRATPWWRRFFSGEYEAGVKP
jgi:serine/threonine protein kinase